MKILIVGGTGLISTAVVNEAVARGMDVTCINRGNNYGNRENPNAKFSDLGIRFRSINVVTAERWKSERTPNVNTDCACLVNPYLSSSAHEKDKSGF